MGAWVNNEGRLIIFSLNWIKTKTLCLRRINQKHLSRMNKKGHLII